MSKSGLVVGAIFGGCHALWCLLVAAGVGQAVLDWVFRLHFLTDPFVVGPFSIETALGLLAFASAAGYAVGWFAEAQLRRFTPP